MREQEMVRRVLAALQEASEPLTYEALAKVIGYADASGSRFIRVMQSLDRRGIIMRVQTSQRARNGIRLLAFRLAAPNERRQCPSGFQVWDAKQWRPYVDVIHTTREAAERMIAELLKPYDRDSEWWERLTVHEIGAEVAA
jgi:hypothetical protein